MNRFVFSFMISFAALLTQNTIAADLSTDMWALAKNYKAFNKADNPENALKSLDAMRIAANDAKLSVPDKLKSLPSNDVEVLAYQSGLDVLIAEIDKTTALVGNNQLEQAKIQGKNMLMIRDENHKKFK